MSSPPPPPDSQAATQIRALSTLSASLPHILTTAATTVSQLTNAPIPHPSSSAGTPDSISARRAAISSSATNYFTSILSLNKALHAQIEALEKAGVIPADEARYRAPIAAPSVSGVMGGAAVAQQKDSEAGVTNNGLGELDVSYLNARARGRMGDDALERLRMIVEGVEEQLQKKRKKEDEDGDMVIDG